MWSLPGPQTLTGFLHMLSIHLPELALTAFSSKHIDPPTGCRRVWLRHMEHRGCPLNVSRDVLAGFFMESMMWLVGSACM